MHGKVKKPFEHLIDMNMLRYSCEASEGMHSWITSLKSKEVCTNL
jgi:hypothetical protein